ncbi:MAG TPA: sulfatase-like hydrolase/transferase [Firmicutes bacterium]|nr:sulfatase-like hydrolase/transferase [Bacillota bacterium]
MRRQPNIILITTDQQRTDSLQCYGSSFTCTPAANRLADEGVLLERAYCADPVCTPARVSLLSGLQVSRHGAWNVGVKTNPSLSLLSHRLKSAGFATHYIGKMHLQPFGAERSLEATKHWEQRFPHFTGPYYGFDSVELALGHARTGITGHYGAWVRSQVSPTEFAQLSKPGRRLAQHPFGGAGIDWDMPVALHNSVWTADRTISWLTQHQAYHPTTPFFLGIGFQDPHHPHMVPVDYPHRVSPDAVPLPDFVPGELADKPPHFQSAHQGKLEESTVRGQYRVAGQGVGADYAGVPHHEARLGRAYYYTMCQLIDQQLTRILDCLDQLRLTENTFVIFTTDHGELLGDHGLWLKGPFHYEQLIKVPLIMRWPAGLPRGRRISGLFSHVDIAPTILAALDLSWQTNEFDGVNALPLLQGETERIRDDVLVECVDDPLKLRLKTLVTEERKLTWYAGSSLGELYDLHADPHERVNQWHNQKYAHDKAHLLSRLLHYMESLERRDMRESYA